MLSRHCSKVINRFVGQGAGKTPGNFRVRRLTTPEEVRVVVSERAALEGWRPGALDHVSYFAADNTGFFAGELDGTPMSCFSVVKYTKNFAYLGSYIVDEQYRGKGYGLKMFTTVLASLGDHFNLAADSVVENALLYLDFGLKPYWEEERVEFVAWEATKNLATHVHESIEILQPSQQFFSALLEYDAKVNTIYRPFFLYKWVFAPNCYCCVAIDSSGETKGYGVVRSTLLESEGWTIGPLFADDSLTARMLLQGLCQRVSAEDPEAKIIIDVPYGPGFSEESLRLIEECRGKPICKFVRIYRGGVPEGTKLNNIFALTSLSVGC